MGTSFNPNAVYFDKEMGDITLHDRYCESATGQVMCSTKMFEIMDKIAECHAAGLDNAMIIQEAASEGLNTSEEAAVTQASASLESALGGLYELVMNSAKKVKTSCEKDLKLIASFAKSQGVNFSTTNLISSTVDPLCKAIDSKGISIKGNGAFLKAVSSRQMVEQYGYANANFMAAFGINIEKVFGDSILSTIFAKFNAKDTSNIIEMRSRLNTGGNAAIRGKQLFGKGSAKTTNRVTRADLKQFVISTYALLAISEFIIEHGKNKADAMSHVRSMLNADTGVSSGKISTTKKNINGDLPTWVSSYNTLIEKIVKSFGDSSTSLVR